MSMKYSSREIERIIGAYPLDEQPEKNLRKNFNWMWMHLGGSTKLEPGYSAFCGEEGRYERRMVRMFTNDEARCVFQTLLLRRPTKCGGMVK